ncbi:MAG: DUF1835 domain-containing protein [Bryobacteraceae bacterium]
MTLHVTNGDSAAKRIRAAAQPLLVWKDVLHEGPVPDVPELNPIRARFLQECGWGDFDALQDEMEQRDAKLLSADSAVLWFEHDLYDQLQLIQILSMLQCPAEMICVRRYLGPMKAAEIKALWPLRGNVSEDQVDLAKRAWAAFRSPDAGVLLQFVSEDLSPLPFLKAALLRLLEEYPGESDGLAERKANSANRRDCPGFLCRSLSVDAGAGGSDLHGRQRP